MADSKTKREAKGTKAAKMKNQEQKEILNSYAAPNSEKANSLLNEPVQAVYATRRSEISKANNLVILHNASKKPESRMTAFEKIDIIREGISKKDLEHLKEKTDLDYNQLSKVLSVARATLINKKGAAKFDMVLSERIVGVADIYSYGYEVFEDENRFNDWIFRSNQALGGQAPYDLLDNQYGREEVKSLIGRIDYGVYS